MRKIIITDAFYWQDFPANCTLEMGAVTLAEAKELLKMMRKKHDVEVVGQCLNKQTFEVAFAEGIHPLGYDPQNFNRVKIEIGDFLMLLELVPKAGTNLVNLSFRGVLVKQTVKQFVIDKP